MKHILRFFVCTFLAVTASAASADWAADGNPISTADDLQMNPVIISDGGSGSIIAWQDRRNATDFDVYVQKVDASGNVLWTADGVGVCTEAGDQSDPRLVSDGAGGAIVTWEDSRSATNFDIYMQRVDTDGNPLWTANGVAVCALDFNQQNPTIASDDAGGAIVVWQDNRGTNADIYAQRVDADGNALWTADGVAVCLASRPQINPIAVSDGAGGAIACWVDKRAGLGDIYVQRMNADSTIAWTANGVALCADPEDQSLPAIASDDIGGAFVAWADKRAGALDIYANYINPTGATVAANGVAICTATGDQSNPSMTFVSFAINHAVSSSVCSVGTSFIAWDDKRTDAGDIYARDFDCVGNSVLPADGLPLCTAPLAQIKPVIASDPLNVSSPVAVWQDQRENFHTDIYAQQVSFTAVVWKENGVKVCGAAGSQFDPVIAFGGGLPIAAWEDLRTGTYDIYAQFVVGTPNAVAITSFDASSEAGAVTLRAAFRSDLAIDGVRVYRGDADGSLEIIAEAASNGGGFEYVDRDVTPGATYRYQIGVVDADGEFFSPIVDASVAALAAGLEQNRPNPFNPSTTIRFVVPTRERVSLIVYDASGRQVRTLVDEDSSAGARDATWDGRDDRGVAQSSGVYFYRLQVGKNVESRKMVLLK